MEILVSEVHFEYNGEQGQWEGERIVCCGWYERTGWCVGLANKHVSVQANKGRMGESKSAIDLGGLSVSRALRADGGWSAR